MLYLELTERKMDSLKTIRVQGDRKLGLVCVGRLEIGTQRMFNVQIATNGPNVSSRLWINYWIWTYYTTILEAQNLSFEKSLKLKGGIKIKICF